MDSETSLIVGLVVGLGGGLVCLCLLGYYVTTRIMRPGATDRDYKLSSSNDIETGINILDISTADEHLLGSSDPLEKIAKSIPVINWSDLSFNAVNKDDLIIGHGTFGAVVRSSLVFQRESGSEERQVVVKTVVYVPGVTSIDDYNSKCKLVTREAAIAIAARRRIAFKNSVVRVYGLVRGPVPLQLCQVLNVPDNATSLGIVMRYEAGGSLAKFIHKRSDATSVPIKERLRILACTARALAELHAIGVIHGDVTPENILLSADPQPQIRLVDFGLASLRHESELEGSLLCTVTHERNAPVYLAPELLPRIDSVTGKMLSNILVEKASRKSDVYAFSILAWELLTTKTPYAECSDLTELSKQVFAGLRPDINELPSECSNNMKQLILSCWEQNRHMRPSTIRYAAVLDFEHSLLCQEANSYSNAYDVIILDHPKDRMVAEGVYHRLTQLACKATCYDFLKSVESTSVKEPFKTFDSVVLVIISRNFQMDGQSVSDLKRALQTHKYVFPLFLEKSPLRWLSEELKSVLNDCIQATSINPTALKTISELGFPDASPAFGVSSSSFSSTLQSDIDSTDFSSSRVLMTRASFDLSPSIIRIDINLDEEEADSDNESVPEPVSPTAPSGKNRTQHNLTHVTGLDIKTLIKTVDLIHTTVQELMTLTRHSAQIEAFDDSQPELEHPQSALSIFQHMRQESPSPLHIQ